MNKGVTIYSYAKVWKFEKKIYVIGKLVLPTPINPYDLLSYLLFLVIMIAIENVFPVVIQIPFVLKYFAIPLFITRYLRKKKLDGKNPVKYFAGCIKYFFVVKGTYLQSFKKNPEKMQNFKLDWDCSMGHYQKKVEEV